MGDIGQTTLTVATGVSVLAFLPVLTQFVNLSPGLWTSLFRTAACIRMEDSKKVQHSRDIVFCACLPALVTEVWAYGLYSREWMEMLHEPFRLLATAGAVLGYMALRAAAGHAMPRKRYSTKVCDAWRGCPKNFWILLTSMLFMASAALCVSGAGPALSKTIMYCMTGLLYALFLIRRFQIFACDSNYLTAILYLCALEILPTGLLLATAVSF